jgi:hypothetical protein
MATFDIRNWIEPILAWVRDGCCAHVDVTSTMCATGATDPPASTGALWMFAFGAWMVLLGLAFIIVPGVIGAISQATLRKLAKETGFPSVAGVWSRLFGLAIATFGLFYFVAAAFELRQFFWMSIFGRLGVFGTCGLLAWRHQRTSAGHSTAGPHLLLWFAVPDLVGATVTAWVMLPHLLARVAFVGGAALLTAALGFFTFPAWIMQLVGVKVKPDTWNVVLGALLAFFGAYDIGSAILGLDPLLLAGIIVNIVLLTALLIELFVERTAIQANWRLRAVVAGLLVASSAALFGTAQ